MQSFEVIEDLSQLDPSQLEDGTMINDGFSSDSDFIDSAFNVMPWLIGIVLVIFVATVIFIIYAQVRNYRKVKDAGMDSLTLQADLATRMARSQVLAPSRSIEEKLRELDQLRSRGVISGDEYDRARRDALKI